jgi:hypothetical protein
VGDGLVEQVGPAGDVGVLGQGPATHGVVLTDLIGRELLDLGRPVPGKDRTAVVEGAIEIAEDVTLLPPLQQQTGAGVAQRRLPQVVADVDLG